MDGSNYNIDKQNVEVNPSTIAGAGMGLFALRDIKKDNYVCSYEGKIVSTEYSNNASAEEGSYLLQHEFLINGEEVVKIIDAIKPQSCLARYMNDPIDARQINVKVDPYDTEHTKLTHNGRRGVIIMLAKKNIKKGDELFLDYSPDYWQEFDRTNNLPRDAIDRLRAKSTAYDTWFRRHYNTTTYKRVNKKRPLPRAPAEGTRDNPIIL